MISRSAKRNQLVTYSEPVGALNRRSFYLQLKFNKNKQQALYTEGNLLLIFYSNGARLVGISFPVKGSYIAHLSQ